MNPRPCPTNARRPPIGSLTRPKRSLVVAAAAAKKQSPLSPTPSPPPPPPKQPQPSFANALLRLDQHNYASLCADPRTLLGWTVMRSGGGRDPVVGTIAAVSRPRHHGAPPPLLRLRRRVALAADGTLATNPTSTHFHGTERHAVPFVREWFPRADPQSKTLWLRGAPPGLLEAGRQRLLLRLLRRELAALLPSTADHLTPPSIPSAAELRTSGRSDLAALVRRAGGQGAAAMALGLASSSSSSRRRRPPGYWDADESVEAELDALVRASWVALPAGGGEEEEDDGENDAVYYYNTASLRHTWDEPFQGGGGGGGGGGEGAGTVEEEEEDVDEEEEEAEDDDDDEEYFGEDDDDESDDEDDSSGLWWWRDGGEEERAAPFAPPLPPLDPRDRVMPPAAAVLAAGRHDLHAAIVRLGGYAAVGERLGRPPANGRRPRRPADPRAPTASSASEDAWWLPPSGRRRERRRRRRGGSSDGSGDEEKEEEEDDDERDELARVERLRRELAELLAQAEKDNDDAPSPAAAPIALPTRRELVSRGRPDLWRAIVALGGARALAAAYPHLLLPGPRGGSVLSFEEAVEGLRAFVLESSSSSASPAAAAPTLRELRESGAPELARAASAHGLARLARAAGLAYRPSAMVDPADDDDDDGVTVEVKGRGGRPLGGSARARVWPVVRRAVSGESGGASPAQLLAALSRASSSGSASSPSLVARATLMRMLAAWVEEGLMERVGRGRYRLKGAAASPRPPRR